MFLKYCLRCLGFIERCAGLCSLQIVPLACGIFLSIFKYTLSDVYEFIGNVNGNEHVVVILYKCFIFKSYLAFRLGLHFPESSRQENHACILSRTGSGYGLSSFAVVLREVCNRYYAHAVLDVMLKD